MSWKITGNPKATSVTKALAEKFALMEPTPNDRPLSEMRLRVYEKLMREGGFRPPEWAGAYCKETGQTYRVNGKHTATVAALLLEQGVKLDLQAIIAYYQCDELADVSRLYSTYDSKVQSRTIRDINRSFASCVPQLADVSARIIELVPSAIAFSQYLNEFSRATTPQDRAEALLEHWDFCVWVDKVLTGTRGYHSSIRRMPIVAAIWATWNKHPRKAEEFWVQVRDESAPLPTDPSRKLARFLLTHSKRGDVRYRVLDKEYFVKALRAWNAWRSEQPTDLRYSPKDPVPSVE